MLEATDCPYTSARELLAEFERKWPRDELGRSGTGTRLVMWGLKKDIHVKKQQGDVIVDATPGASRHERSLRAYAEVLYLKVGTKVQPTMAITMRDSPVVPRDWQAYLVEMPNEFVLPKPHAADVAAQFKAEKSGRAAQASGRDATAMMTIGYARPMRDLMSLLSGTKKDEAEVEEKNEIAVEETGFFVYHKGRMTRLLEKIRLQTKKSNVAQTSKLRITQAGEGLTGFILETYLVQLHNKSAYLDRRLFDNLMMNANLKAKDFLRRHSCRKHGEVCGYLPVGLPDLPAISGDGPPNKSAGAKEKPKVLEEEIRMRPVNPKDLNVGRVVKSQFSKGRYHLRRPDFTLSERSYIARDLVPTVFDPNKDLEPGMVAAPKEMAGCKAEVWWLPETEDDTGSFWQATLNEPPRDWTSPAVGGSRAGWFLLTYADGFDEAFFIALKPGDATIMAAFRDDGERLPGGIEFKLRDESSAQLTSVVDLLRQTPQLALQEEQSALQQEQEHSALQQEQPAIREEQPISISDPSMVSSALSAPKFFPSVGSVRHETFLALCGGHSSRDAICRHVCRKRKSRSRAQIVTILCGEKATRVPLWVQHGTSYTLTPAALEAAHAAGIHVEDAANANRTEEFEVEVEAESDAEMEAKLLSAMDVEQNESAFEGGSKEPLNVTLKFAVVPAAATCELPTTDGASSANADLPAHYTPGPEGTAGADLSESSSSLAADVADVLRLPTTLRPSETIAPMVESTANSPAGVAPAAPAPAPAAPPAPPSAMAPPPSVPTQSAVEAHAATAKTLPSATELRAGQRIKAKYLASDPSIRPTAREISQGYGPGRWYPGYIREVRDDGMCTIDYDDGETEMVVSPKFIVPLEDDLVEDEFALMPLAMANSTSSSHSSKSNSSNSAVPFVSINGADAGPGSRRSGRRGPMTMRGAVAVADLADKKQSRVRTERDEALKRVSVLEEELASSREAEASLREQLRSVMQQVASLHETSAKSKEQMLDEHHTSAVAALGLRAQLFLQGESADGHGMIVPATAPSQSDETGKASETAADKTMLEPTDTAAPSAASGALHIDQIHTGCRVRVWFTRMMLRERNATPRFESGVVTWVGEPELARRGVELTVRFRVQYDDGASHEHLLNEDIIELEEGNDNAVGSPGRPRDVHESWCRTKRKAAEQATTAMSTATAMSAQPLQKRKRE